LNLEKTADVFGYKIFAGSLDELADGIREDISKDQQNVIFAMNPNKVMLAKKDAQIKRILKSADILIPDGIGLIRAARMFGEHISERITGIDLMEKWCQIAETDQLPIFLYGAAKESVSGAVGELKKKFEMIPIVGYNNGYDQNAAKVVDKIQLSGAKILFVGLGSPAQEEFIYQYKNDLTNIRLFVGVGGSFDVISGQAKRAPKWMIRLNLEWLYRMVAQPGRVKRYGFLLQFMIYTWIVKWRKRNEG
jgi:N-acetylglucosaminyldiphosphoundecaprenol N-acetyl-beta-D-mannosaminyltransferase